MSESAPGPQLKAEREKRGLSLQKAADELHLDAWVIEALESGDYQRIGATVYAKGHLKRYAGLLGLPAAAIMAGYESGSIASPAVSLTSQSARMAGAKHEPQLSNLSPGRTLGLALGAAVLLGLFWWRPWHQRGANSPSPVASQSAVTAPGPGPVQQSEAPPQEQSVEAPKGTQAMVRDTSHQSSSATPLAAASPVAAAMPAPVNDANAAALQGAGHARLRLSFSAGSWVDVHDATGKRVFAGNGPANSVKSIAGVAPLKVYLGAGSGVTLEINDRTVAIGPQFFSGDVARFDAGADGVLRRDQTHAAPATSAAAPAPTRNARPRG